MLFVPILVVAIILYMSGYRVYSVLLFCFFLFDGFQIVPESLFETPYGFSKATDFAWLYIIILFIWGCFFYNDFIPKNRMTYLIFIYLSMIFILILISRFVYGIGWGDIIRTSRNFFFVLSYFVLRRLDKKDIEYIFNILLVVLLIQCLLFIFQAFTGIPLLTGSEGLKSEGVISRFYNTPRMIYFFLFYVCFGSKFKNKLGYIIALILLITIFLPLHRGLSIVVILSILIGYVLQMRDLRRFIKYIPYFIIIFVPLAVILMYQLSSRTITDIQSVREGSFLETEDFEDFEVDSESTLLFRVGHFYERYVYAQDNFMNKYFGLGLMTENSRFTKDKFTFLIGLRDDKTGDTVQLDTSDIAWSTFVIRYGYIGTIVYLYFYFSLMYHFFKKRENDYAFSLFLLMILIFGFSITSDLLYQTSRLVFVFILYDLTLKNNSYEKGNSVDVSL